MERFRKLSLPVAERAVDSLVGLLCRVAHQHRRRVLEAGLGLAGLEVSVVINQLFSQLMVHSSE